MKSQKGSIHLWMVVLISTLMCCKPVDESDSGNYLLSFSESGKDGCGYKNSKGNVIIPAGRYSMCFTDTFRTFAIVLKPSLGFVAIDRQEAVLYEVYPFDNGPDPVADGLFRIRRDQKIGYADALTGNVVIEPQYTCAYPFENGMAKVSTDCTSEADGEHTTWISDHWSTIDKAGRIIDAPK
jgi:hypothetical protein